MKKGKYIVFEGVSGTGKETQAKALSAALAKKFGIASSIIYHPTPELKDILRDWRTRRKIDDTTEVYLLLADRSDRMRRDIKPLLARGSWVISLRSFVSALVYQGKTEKDRRWITNEFRHFEPTPDVLYYFSLSPAEALLRIRKRHEETGEPYGKFETPEYLKEKNQAFRRVLADIPHVPIDAGQSIEKIHKNIMNALIPFLPKTGAK